MNEDSFDSSSSTYAPSLNGRHKTPVYTRSEIVEEIISKKSGFLEKWAILVFTALLTLVIAATWLIKYPDTIDATAYLSAKNAPKEIIPLQEGRLIALYVHNDEYVTTGQPIGWIQSTASHSEIQDLSSRLDNSIKYLMAGNAKKAAGLFDHPYSNLGELQTAYQQFVVAWQQANDYLVNGFYIQKKALLENDINTLDRTNESLSHQKDLTAQAIQLAQESFNMNNTLSREKIISAEELRTQKGIFLNKQMQIDQLNVSLFSNESQKSDKQKEINQLDHDFAQQKLLFLQALQSLRSAVDDWIKKYVLSAPVDGKVVFAMPLQQDQFLQQDKLIAYINPIGSICYARVTIPQSNSGKIDTGLKVQLRFDAYPYQESGFVSGTLDYISKIASDSGFQATIRLDKGLITDHGVAISYKDGLKADAVVITKDMRLLQRFYFNLVKSSSLSK